MNLSVFALFLPASRAYNKQIHIYTYTQNPDYIDDKKILPLYVCEIIFFQRQISDISSVGRSIGDEVSARYKRAKCMLTQNETTFFLK